MNEPVTAVAADARARRHIKRLLNDGARRRRSELSSFDKAISRAAASDSAADRSAALKRLAKARASHAALRDRIEAVPRGGDARRRIVGALALMDRSFGEFAECLTVGQTRAGLAHARRAARMANTAMAALGRGYEELG